MDAREPFSRATAPYRLPSDPARRHTGPTLLRLGGSWTPLGELAGPERQRQPIYERAAYARIPVWTNRHMWLLNARRVFHSPKGTTLRRAYGGLSETAFMDVMRVDAATADSRTGRNVYTSHETVSFRCQRPVATVRRARQIAERLGLAVTVDRGRYLPRRDWFRAGRTWNPLQRRKASTRALTMSRPQVIAQYAACAGSSHSSRRSRGIGHLPLRGSAPSILPLKKTHQTRERAARKEKTPPPSLSALKLAGRLAATAPHLGRHGHLNGLARVLERHLGASLEAWTSSVLLHRINLATIAPQTITNPIGWISWALGKADLTPPAARQGAPNVQLEHSRPRAVNQAEINAKGAALARAALRRNTPPPAEPMHTT